MNVEYEVLGPDDDSMQALQFEPEYFKSQVSTEVKDRAKDMSLIYFDKEEWKISYYGEVAVDLLETLGLEDFLIHQMKKSKSRWEKLSNENHQTTLDSFIEG